MFGGGRTSGNLNSMSEADDSIVDKGSVAYLKKTLLSTIKLGGEASELKELEAEFAWSGVMGYSRDNAPWVGGVPGMSGIWLCAGYTGHGMPNATLCAKAVVEMLLADEKGEDVSKVQRRMVEGGRIPVEYVITAERMREASILPSIKEQDESGIMGYSNGKWVVQGKL
jgi:glycine/D-amino acid oxidase-like deaminating enzyme